MNEIEAFLKNSSKCIVRMALMHEHERISKMFFIKRFFYRKRLRIIEAALDNPGWEMNLPLYVLNNGSFMPIGADDKKYFH